MSIFSELLPQLNAISVKCFENFQKEVQVAFDYLENFEKEYENGRNQGKEKAPKDKVRKATLQSIVEDDGDPNKVPEMSSSKSSSTDSNGEQRRSKKRSKNEAEDILSPEVDKRQKRSASVKAQTFISKQVNVNLSAKLRREKSTDSVQAAEKPDKAAPKGHRRKDGKENAEPNMPTSVPIIQIKEEKISLPPQLMDMDSLPPLPADVPVKQEPTTDDMAMPPPALPPPALPRPKARQGLAQDKSESRDEEAAGRRSARNKKLPAEAMQPPSPPPPAPAPVSGARSTRASSRARPALQAQAEEQPPPEPRPKRTRAKKKASVSEAESSEVDGGGARPSLGTVSGAASPAEKPRPKRTRRRKAADKEEPPKLAEPYPTVSPKEEPTSTPSSPILQKDVKSKKKGKADLTSITIQSTVSCTTINSIDDLEDTKVIPKDMDKTRIITKDLDKTKFIVQDMDKTNVISKDLDKTRVISKDLDKTRVIDKDLDKTKALNKDMDKTIVLTNGVYNHETVSPKIIHNMNETVLIQKASTEAVLLDKPAAIMDCTVVIDKAGGQASKLTEDNSLLTDDEDEEFHTPPAKSGAPPQPSSAVKEKVQQFEELASRVTRTKTRALAKQEGEAGRDTQTPPDKVVTAGLSADTLHKMNTLIFNGKPQPQVSSSACKPRAPAATKSALAASASASKLASLGRQREAAEEDARKKKEALLEAKKEQQKRKREEKMAAAALARNNAERDRRAQLELLAKEKMEKQAHADLGKLERMKEHERKKQELARKAAETEERRRAEEAARAQRLADEQRRALLQRRKQIEEQEAMKKEAAKMAKEIEKRQKEYLDKQRLKSRLEDKVTTPLKTPLKGYHGHISPVYMLDGFQYLNSDSEDEGPPRPVPEWSTSRTRKAQLDIQSHVAELQVARLFSVRVHTPDLADIFPCIERARLKRTSSAVWRTPPALATLLE